MNAMKAMNILEKFNSRFGKRRLNSSGILLDVDESGYYDTEILSSHNGIQKLLATIPIEEWDYKEASIKDFFSLYNIVKRKIEGMGIEEPIRVLLPMFVLEKFSEEVAFEMAFLITKDSFSDNDKDLNLMLKLVKKNVRQIGIFRKEYLE